MKVDVRPVDGVKRAIINESSIGDNEVVAAVAGKKICVLSFGIVAAGDVDAKFRSGTTDITGLMDLAAAGNGLVAAPSFPGYHHFETAAGAALNLNLSAAVNVGGWVVYYED